LILVGLIPGLLTVDCEVPAFWVKGKAYKIAAGMAGSSATILEIDKQSYWINVESKKKGYFTGKEFTETVWLNLRQVVMIEETQ